LRDERQPAHGLRGLEPRAAQRRGAFAREVPGSGVPVGLVDVI
jgi:hypothetical protein